jgi:hypothetical protein
MSVCCECCQAEVSETGRSLVQRSPTDCGDLETPRKRWSWHELGCCARYKNSMGFPRLRTSATRCINREERLEHEICVICYITTRSVCRRRSSKEPFPVGASLISNGGGAT